MSNRRRREPGFPLRGELHPDDEVDPSRFFGETDRSRKTNWKALQLCKQVERAAAVSLAGAAENESLLGASVAGVEPAPDQGRLRAIVVLAPGMTFADATEARAALQRHLPALRAEVAGSIHRKRVPEIVFDVRLAEEGAIHVGGR